MTDMLAVYAAVVATAGIGWQAYTWWRDRTVKVAVDVSYGTPVSSGEDLVFITVTKESTFPVSWTQAGMDLQDGTARFALVGLGDKVAAGFELPAVIPSLDSHRTAVEASKAVTWGFDLYRPVVAQVRLGRGGVFKSKPKTLLSTEGAR